MKTQKTAAKQARLNKIKKQSTFPTPGCEFPVFDKVAKVYRLLFFQGMRRGREIMVYSQPNEPLYGRTLTFEQCHEMFDFSGRLTHFDQLFFMRMDDNTKQDMKVYDITTKS